MIRDTTASYGVVSIILHWLSAVGILVVMGLGAYVVYYGYYTSDFLQYAHLHYALGILIFFVMSLRLLWRLSSRTPISHAKALSIKILIALIKLSLYVLAFIVIISGYLICTSEGQSINVFGIVEIPSLMLLETEELNIAGLAHKYLAWIFFSIILLHALAALIHHFIIKDNTLRRMLKPNK